MAFTGPIWTKILALKACCLARNRVKARPLLSDGFSAGKQEAARNHKSRFSYGWRQDAGRSGGVVGVEREVDDGCC